MIQKTSRQRKVYVYQFGQWWSVDVDKWLEVCEEIESTEESEEDPIYNPGYKLDNIGQRIGIPYHAVWVMRGNSHESKSIIKRPGALVAIMPCDWDDETWKEEATNIKKALIENTDKEVTEKPTKKVL